MNEESAYNANARDTRVPGKSRQFFDQFLLAAAAANEDKHVHWSQGFRSQDEASAFAEHLRQTASTIHDAEWSKLERSDLIEIGSDQTRLGALKKLAAGDTTGAARDALENQLNAEEDAIDPNDKERLQRFGAIRQQTLANFDADAARHLGHDAENLVGKLADTARRLDDAATKLDKLVANAKAPTILKD